MAYNHKKLVLGGLGGVLIAVLIITGFAWMGFLPTAEAKGQLVIRVKDAPADLSELWLNITEVWVHREGVYREGGEKVKDTWYTVALFENLPWINFNLLAFPENGDLSLLLAVDQLEVGNYTEIRLHIANASAKIGDELKPLQVTTDWVMVKTHFKIQENPVTIALIDIDVSEEPILTAGILMPVAKATVQYGE